jgi:hypothetical protein
MGATDLDHELEDIAVSRARRDVHRREALLATITRRMRSEA